MSILKRRLEIDEVERKAKELLDLCGESRISFDVLICEYFSRKEIKSNLWGIDKNYLIENLDLWGYSPQDIQGVLDQFKSSRFIESFSWRKREVFDFEYRDKLEYQSHFIRMIEEAPLFKSRLGEIQRDIDVYLLHRIKEEKDENVASTLRLLFSIPLPEIGTRSELGSIAEFHFKSISGERWIDIVSDLLRKKVILMRLNFLPTNPAAEYFVPQYAIATVSVYLSYSNNLLKKTLERMIKSPIFDQNFQVPEEHKAAFLNRGLCFRKWTTPKVELTEDYVPTPFLHQILVKETVEIPELIIKSYPDEELWTYYLIGNCLINAKQTISILSPYTDKTTFTHFVKEVPKDIEVRILTSRTGGNRKERMFFEVLRKMWEDGYRIEVLKIVRESGRVPIHGRYIIQDNRVVLDLPGDLKKGFSGVDKAENIKWIPFEDKIIAYNDQFGKLWNLNLTESDFVKDSSAILGTKLSFAKPASAMVYKVHLVDGRVKMEEKTISLDQFLAQI